MSPTPGRFHFAAKHYLKGRPPYGNTVIQRVVQICGLNASSRVFDLGCGPGNLARAFAPFVGEIIGIDPEPEMLNLAREEATRAGLTIEFRQGASQDIDSGLGLFRIVVMGRAFHWMERAETLLRLASIVEQQGAIVLFDDSWPKVPDNRWTDQFDEQLDRFSVADAAQALRRSLTWMSHEAVLLDSPFPNIERISVLERRHTLVEHFVERALSHSSVACVHRDGRASELARDVRVTMCAFAVDGHVTEVIETSAIIAKRIAAT